MFRNKYKNDKITVTMIIIINLAAHTLMLYNASYIQYGLQVGGFFYYIMITFYHNGKTTGPKMLANTLYTCT